jgi:hypothetical protein
MENDPAVIKMALRVLTAIMEHCPPDAADVKELRRFAPLDADVPVDELACEVVHEVLTRRAQRSGVGAHD